MSSTPPRPAVVVPAYKTTLNGYEWISLRRAFEVFTDTPIRLLVPVSLQAEAADTFRTLLEGHRCARLEPIADHWLSSVEAYNQLCLDPLLYQRFRAFSHLLIYQLDAYVFTDELLTWCRQDLDYIGAPIYPLGVPYGKHRVQCIGAGGFSLRRTTAFLRALESNPPVFRLADFRRFTAGWGFKARVLRGLRFAVCLALGGNHLANGTHTLFHWMGINEDVLYGQYVPKALPWFQVPTYDQARQFCIDRYVQDELAAMGGQLPFGAHGWWTSEANLAAWRGIGGLAPPDPRELKP